MTFVNEIKGNRNLRIIGTIYLNIQIISESDNKRAFEDVKFPFIRGFLKFSSLL